MDGLGRCWGRDRSWEGGEGLETLGLLHQGLERQPWALLVPLQPQPRASLFSVRQPIPPRTERGAAGARSS